MCCLQTYCVLCVVFERVLCVRVFVCWSVISTPRDVVRVCCLGVRRAHEMCVCVVPKRLVCCVLLFKGVVCSVLSRYFHPTACVLCAVFAVVKKAHWVYRVRGPQTCCVFLGVVFKYEAPVEEAQLVYFVPCLLTCCVCCVCVMCVVCVVFKFEAPAYQKGSHGVMCV